MTYYADKPYAFKSRTPLIDLIPDHHDDLDASDEEDSFYGKEDDFLIPARWQQRIDRLPRRIKRFFVAGFAFAFLFLVSWWAYLGPQYAAYRHELKLMNEAPGMAFGSNAHPGFKDMIQLKKMDEHYLPKKGKRLVFVGDVHGCRKELEHLMKKVDFRHKHDHLILTGDMISKGPDSPGVVRLMQDVGASCVRGNWEDKLLLTVADAQPRAPSTSSDSDNQPLDFLDTSRGDPRMLKLAKEFTRKELNTLQQCPVILHVGTVPHLGNLVAVHAGLVPDIPLEKQDPFHVMNMRTIDLQTRIPSSKHDGTPWEKFWNHRQKKLKEHERTTVIYGHNRKRGLNIHPYSKGLDTGCVSGSHLTALVVDDKGHTELVSVKCSKAAGFEQD
ncbi:Metallo-dependent phosphatase [Ophiobolus disseminans]|uniref:Metallo-dependent phosphatase n=1 Tax=Ophiobolus disseminans TaxID=1469910 RepID=A0A6A6ZKN5_9PLEO|nr:Metallo-dependent phosphatase [Ophiobolus disseminans]